MNAYDYQIEAARVLDTLPPEFHHAVRWMAWEQGHSAGYEEVINILRGLVSDLDAPCKNFEARIRESL